VPLEPGALQAQLDVFLALLGTTALVVQARLPCVAVASTLHTVQRHALTVRRGIIVQPLPVYRYLVRLDTQQVLRPPLHARCALLDISVPVRHLVHLFAPPVAGALVV
jgi:hypothetical protein